MLSLSCACELRWKDLDFQLDVFNSRRKSPSLPLPQMILRISSYKSNAAVMVVKELYLGFPDGTPRHATSRRSFADDATIGFPQCFLL